MLNRDLLANNLQSCKVSKKDRFCQELHVKYLSDEVATAKQAVLEAREVMYEATRTTYAEFVAICRLELDNNEEMVEEGIEFFESLCDVAHSDAHYVETEQNMIVAQKAFKVAEQVLRNKKKELRNYSAQLIKLARADIKVANKALSEITKALEVAEAKSLEIGFAIYKRLVTGEPELVELFDTNPSLLELAIERDAEWIAHNELLDDLGEKAVEAEMIVAEAKEMLDAIYMVEQLEY